MNCVRIPSIAKKNVAWNSINGYLPAQGCRKRGAGGTCPPPPRFWQISKPYLNQEGQIILSPPFRFSDLPPSLLHTMSWPRHGNFNHGNCTQQWNNPHMQLDSPIKHSSVEHFFFLSNYPFFSLCRLWKKTCP